MPPIHVCSSSSWEPLAFALWGPEGFGIVSSVVGQGDEYPGQWIVQSLIMDHFVVFILFLMIF